MGIKEAQKEGIPKGKKILCKGIGGEAIWITDIGINKNERKAAYLGKGQDEATLQRETRAGTNRKRKRGDDLRCESKKLPAPPCFRETLQAVKRCEKKRKGHQRKALETKGGQCKAIERKGVTVGQ